MENRITTLENILPTLATKSDISELRLEMHQMRAADREWMQKSISEVHKWMLGTMITIIGTIGISMVIGFTTVVRTLAPITTTQQT
jgi:CHASE3 domain sensor protein